MALSATRSRPIRLTAVAFIALAMPLAAEEPSRPLALEVERAAAAALRDGPPDQANPILCGTECRVLRETADEKAFIGGWGARGVGLALGLSAGFAFGDGARPVADPTTLRGGWLTGDTVLAGVTAAAFVSTRLFDRPPPSLAGGCFSNCRNGRDGLNRLDRSIAEALGGKPGRLRAGAVSDMTLFTTVGLPFGLALGANPDQRGRDLAVAAGTFAANLAFADIVKRLADRPRPFAHFCRPYEAGDLCQPDAHYSFYSGHSSTSFSMAVAAGMLSHYHRYRNEGWVWATGLGLATTTGVLRIAADKHYFSDVVTGAAAGALVGWLVPRIHRPDQAVGPPPVAMATPSAAVSVPVRLGGLGGQGLVRAGFGAGPSLEVSWHW